MATKEWTDELKQEVTDAYLAEEPTAENSLDIVKSLAEQFEKTPNGVRMILVKAGVYVKKEKATSGTAAATGDKPKRVNKAESIDALKKTIADAGKAVDDDICDRLTGKAAVYFAELLG